MSSSFSLEGACVWRGDRRVLEHVSLDVARGERVALMGPSGSGKSTLLRALLGLCPIRRGSIRIRGALASRPGRIVIPPEERELAVVFQDLALWPHLSVEGHLRFVLAARKVPRSEWPPRIRAQLERVGLESLSGRRPGELSGGERQRLALARALTSDPDALLLDEPLSNLDLVTRRELADLLSALCSARSIALLHVTHDPEEAAHLGSRVVVLEAGRIAYRGSLEGLVGSSSAFARATHAARVERGRDAGQPSARTSRRKPAG